MAGGQSPPAVRRAREEKLESLLRSAHLVSCSSSRKVGALFINVWLISSGSCSHIPGPSAISSTNRLVPPRYPRRGADSRRIRTHPATPSLGAEALHPRLRSPLAVPRGRAGF